MPIFFTSVKKHVTKKADSISRLLGYMLKNPETRAISCVEIRDIEAKIL